MCTVTLLLGTVKELSSQGVRLPIHQRENIKVLLSGMLKRKVIEPSQWVVVIPSSVDQKKMGPHNFVWISDS